MIEPSFVIAVTESRSRFGSMVIPFASIVSIAGLQAAGIPIHQMSITGLIVALGLLVDGAIVMTDDVRKRLHDGTETLQAVEQAVKRLTVPLSASTATTVFDNNIPRA